MKITLTTKRMICAFAGHKRGKRTGVSSSLGAQFQCPRCKQVWNRKVRAAEKENKGVTK